MRIVILTIVLVVSLFVLVPAYADFVSVSGHAGWMIEYDTPQSRSWGFEQDFVLRDPNGKEHSYQTRFKGNKPNKGELDSRVGDYIDRLNNPTTGPERTYQESEVVKILVENGYLKDGDKLSDLKPKAVQIGP